MGVILSGLSGRLVGVWLAVSASASVPTLPYVSETVAGFGLAETPVVALLVLFTSARLVVGVALCARGATGSEAVDPLAFGEADEDTAGGGGAIVSDLLSTG